MFKCNITHALGLFIAIVVFSSCNQSDDAVNASTNKITRDEVITGGPDFVSVKFKDDTTYKLSMEAVNEYDKADVPKDDDFFPLRVGDKFLYKLSPESEFWVFTRNEEVEVRVTRQVDTLGKKYYVIENYFLVGTGFEGIIYARKDGHNVYFFAPDKEVLYYSFDPSDDKEYFVPDGITRFGEWPLGANIGFVYVMKKTDVDNNQITFLTKGPEGYSNYKHSSKFEKGKGLIQVISHGDLGTVIYDLVEVYR